MIFYLHISIILKNIYNNNTPPFVVTEKNSVQEHGILFPILEHTVAASVLKMMQIDSVVRLLKSQKIITF